MSHWFIYWITRLDALEVVFVILSIISIITCVACYITGGAMKLAQEENTARTALKFGRKFIIPSLLFLLLDTFIPNTKEAVVIYLVPKFINNEKIVNLPEKAVDLLNMKFDEWIKEQMPNEDNE